MLPRLTDLTDLTDTTDKMRKKRHVVKKQKTQEATAILRPLRHDTVFRDIVRPVRPVRKVSKSRKTVNPDYIPDHASVSGVTSRM